MWYGPDTYMGRNLAALFASMAAVMSDEEIKALHPAHSRQTVKELLPRFRWGAGRLLRLQLGLGLWL